MRTKLILVLIMVIMALIGLWQIDVIKRQKSEINRKDNNIMALTSDIHTYKVNDSITVSQKRVMELKASEFEHLFMAESEKARLLGIKIKNLQNVTVAEVTIRDTITNIKIEKITDSLSRFSYSDNFFVSLNGEIRHNDVDIDYNARLEIDLIQHKEQKRFLGFLWRTSRARCYKVEAFSMNPKVQITGLTVIKID